MLRLSLLKIETRDLRQFVILNGNRMIHISILIPSDWLIHNDVCWTETLRPKEFYSTARFISYRNTPCINSMLLGKGNTCHFLLFIYSYFVYLSIINIYKFTLGGSGLYKITLVILIKNFRIKCPIALIQ